jgi:hypothetical protein
VEEVKNLVVVMCLSFSLLILSGNRGAKFPKKFLANEPFARRLTRGKRLGEALGGDA